MFKKNKKKDNGFLDDAMSSPDSTESGNLDSVVEKQNKNQFKDVKKKPLGYGSTKKSFSFNLFRLLGLKKRDGLAKVSKNKKSKTYFRDF